jgi:hypothetical protein
MPCPFAKTRIQTESTVCRSTVPILSAGSYKKKYIYLVRSMSHNEIYSKQQFSKLFPFYEGLSKGMKKKRCFRTFSFHSTCKGQQFTYFATIRFLKRAKWEQSGTAAVTSSGQVIHGTRLWRVESQRLPFHLDIKHSSPSPLPSSSSSSSSSSA